MKTFYELPEYVDSYIESTKNIDGRKLVAELEKYLQPDSSILELGMGTGKDFEILAEKYQVTGSDYSQLFLEKFRNTHPKAELLWLDAIHIETAKTFDAIYSNKVMHHLSLTELEKSLLRQVDVLHENGLVCHSFLHGIESFKRDALLFTHYQKADLIDVFEMNYEVLYCEFYTETTEDDSILVIAKKLD